MPNGVVSCEFGYFTAIKRGAGSGPSLVPSFASMFLASHAPHPSAVYPMTSAPELTPVANVSPPEGNRRKKSSSVPCLNQALKKSLSNTWPTITPLFAIPLTDNQQGAPAPGWVGFMVLNEPLIQTQPLFGNVPYEGSIPHSPPTTVPALFIPKGTVTRAVAG